MYFLPIYITLISFLISSIFGKYIGSRGACFFTSFFLFVSFFVCLYIYYEVVINNSPCFINLSDWFYIDILDVSWSFYFDSLTATMLLVITFISFCAHLYSIEYMQFDPHQIRFMSYLSLFTFFMIILVTSGNLVQLFVGWEGVGICSYLLINFWYTRIKANKSAIMAVLTNRIGDLSLLIAFGIIFFIYKSFSFDVLFSYVHIYNFTIFMNNDNYELFSYIVCILLIIGAVGKSAQVGLHMWLPEAMEGPTPVSSLIHAATMVTAGIFLIIRCSYLFEIVPISLLWIIFLGSITTLFASSIGIVQNDLKKIIAYSTCSQLGYMFLSCGLSGYNYSLFHLFNHAFFKALLFLTAGYIIHSISNEQDIRKMGLLYKFLPFSNIMILYASLSLIGFDFTSGYYSKDKIIELFYNRYSLSLLDNFNFNIYIMLQFLSSVAIYCTILYSVKLTIYVFYGLNINNYFIYFNSWKINYNNYFLGKFNYYNLNINKIHYGGLFIYIPLILLFFLSFSSGYLFKDIMIGEGLINWNETFYISIFSDNFINNNFNIINFEYNDYFKGILHEWVFYLLIVSIYIYCIFRKNFFYFIIFSSNYFLFFYKYLVEKYIIINKVIIDIFSELIFKFSYNISYLLIDKGLIEKIGPFSIYKIYKLNLYKSKTINHNYTTNLFIFYLVSLFILLILFM